MLSPSPQAQPDNDPSTVTRDVHEIPYVFHRGRFFQTNPDQWLDALRERLLARPSVLHDYRACAVQHVAYYAHPGINHDLLLATIAFAAPAGPQTVNIAVERLRFAGEDSRGPLSFLRSSPTPSEYVTGFAHWAYEHTSEDAEKHNDRVTLLFEDYASSMFLFKHAQVASFAPPPGTLGVLDLAVAASALTSMAKEHDARSQTSTWYAIVGFNILHALAAERADGGAAVPITMHRKAPRTWNGVPFISPLGVLQRDRLGSLLQTAATPEAAEAVDPVERGLQLVRAHLPEFCAASSTTDATETAEKRAAEA